MTRQERKQWSNARTVAEARELTAQWLDGTITYHPGYTGGGPDPETLPLASTFAVLNRAGMLTANSQPGGTGNGWQDRSYVTGYAPTTVVAGLQRALKRHAHVDTRAVRPNRWHKSISHPVVVGTAHGRTRLTLDHHMTRRNLDTEWGGLLHSTVINAIATQQQVTIYAHDFGPTPQLWLALRQWAHASAPMSS